MKDLYRFLKLKWSDIEGTAQRLGISPKFVVRDVLLAWTQDRLVSADCAAYGGYSANSTYIPRGYARLSRDLDIKMDFRRYSKPDVAIRELNAALEDRGDVLDLEYRGYVVRVGEVVPNPAKVGAGLRADVQLIFLKRSMLSPYVGMSFSTWLSRHEIYSNYPPEVRQGLLRKFKEVFGPEARIHEIDIDVCLEAPEVIQESEVVSARPVTADVPFTLTCRILRPELLEESYRNAFLNFLQRLETRNLVKTVIDLQVKSLPLDELYTYLHASDALLIHRESSQKYKAVVSSSVCLVLGSGCPILFHDSNFVELHGDEIVKYRSFEDMKAKLTDIFSGRFDLNKVKAFLKEHNAENIAKRFVLLFEELIKTHDNKRRMENG